MLWGGRMQGGRVQQRGKDVCRPVRYMRSRAASLTQGLVGGGVAVAAAHGAQAVVGVNAAQDQADEAVGQGAEGADGGHPPALLQRGGGGVAVVAVRSRQRFAALQLRQAGSASRKRRGLHAVGPAAGAAPLTSRLGIWERTTSRAPRISTITHCLSKEEPIFLAMVLMEMLPVMLQCGREGGEGR